MAARTRPVTVLLLLGMLWTAVWCCCRPPQVTTTVAAVRSCCVATPAPSSCPTQTPGECPIDHVRQTRVSAVAVALPALNPGRCPLANLVLQPPLLRSELIAARRADPADPPPVPPTLLTLHTSLLC